MSDSNLDIKHDLNMNLNRDLRDFKDFKESPRDLPVLQRKSSSVLNSLASKKLCHQPSKLDLIDDTTLTSLPLPPPPPKVRLRRGDLNSSKLSRMSTATFHDVSTGAAGASSSSLGKCATSLDSLAASVPAWPDEVSPISELTDDNYDTTVGPDDTFDEHQDPIVLVEDYVRGIPDEMASTHSLTRKQSLATFKQRMMTGSRCLSAVVSPAKSPFRAGSKRSISNEDTTIARLEIEDLEAIFGKIPGSDKLKYCDLCDKPLYEISSIISSTEDRKLASQNEEEGESAKNDISHLYNEFICWECINVYEHFLNELYEVEVGEEKRMQLQTNKDSSSTEKLLSMFNSIRETYHTELSEPPKKQTKTAFSTDLIDRLHYLSTMSEPQKNGTEWLNNLRQRLRWRWRLENLLPNPFAFDKHRND